MSKSARLFELLLTLHSKQKFTVNELATTFSVSRRTMLRDLQLLSEIGVPLCSSPGPNGGYSLIKEQKLPAISLTLEEATGILLSYEMLEQVQDGPFKKENMSTLTKIRSSIPTDMLNDVEKLREKIAIDTPRRSVRNPYLSELLRASRESYHLEIGYDSRSGMSTRVIFPHGIYMSNGLWYCLAYCYKRNTNVALRVDRVTALQERPDFTGGQPEAISVHNWLREFESTNPSICLKARLTRRGCKLLDPELIGEWIKVQPDGSGTLVGDILPSDIDHYGRVFLSLGDEIHVEEPEEIISFMKEEARKILRTYEDARNSR